MNRALRALELIAEERELGVFELGRRLRVHKATASRLVATLAERGLEELADRTRETVNLGVLSGDAVVYIEQVTGTRSSVAVSWAGRRTPPHFTSNGNVLVGRLVMQAAASISRRMGYVERRRTAG